VSAISGADERRFFFVHLQKTGGIALFRRLRIHFGTDAVYPMPQYQGTPESSLGVAELLERFAAHREQIRVVTGHFPLCVTELLGVPFTTFTVLREPVERTLSLLRHRREIEPGAQSLALEAIYDDPVVRERLARNHMVRMLSLRPEEMTDGALTHVEVDAARVEAAKANMAERIDVVGLQERFDEFCDELAIRYGWDLGPPQFANRSQPVDVDEGLRARIERDNALDVELYRFAVELVEARQPVDPASDRTRK
jgi:hypothetical protein